mmetsp:Transcript_43989/g.127007  ORF Transcript_43989/g.127007 Transcript_43989/m.127007 type:complete len:396 (+) Transcript_43989:154-1341(+)
MPQAEHRVCARRPGASLSTRVLRLEQHQVPQGRNSFHLLVRVVRLLDGSVHRREHLVDDVQHALLHRFYNLRRDVGQHANPLHNALLDLTAFPVDRGQVRGRTPCADPCHEALDALLDQLSNLGYLGDSLRLVVLHDLLEVVDGVRANVLHLGALARDVARNGDVDEHHTPLPASHVRGEHDRHLAVRGGEDHVALVDDLLQTVHRSDLCVRATPALYALVLEQGRGLLLGPVDDRHLHIGELAEQREQQQPRHIPRAQNADPRVPPELPEVLHGLRRHQLHSGAGYGDRALSDVGLRPHELAGADARLRQPRDELPTGAGHRTRRLGLVYAVLVALLDLGQDLGLADDEGVQPGTHLEQVPHAVRPGVREQVPVELLAGQARLLAEEGAHRLPR